MNAIQHPSARKGGSPVTCLALLTLVVSLSSGCLSLESLRARRYSEITIRHLEAAGRSGDERVYDGVVGLLELRLDEPTAVDLDYALEALAALMGFGRSDAAGIVSRCACQDASEEVRYMALEVLVRLAPATARGALATAAREDGSNLVREKAQELLARIDRPVAGIAR